MSSPNTAVGKLGILFGTTALAVAALAADPATRPSTRPVMTQAQVAARLAELRQQRAARLATRPAPSDDQLKTLTDDLRSKYQKAPAEWPPATIDPGVIAVELGTPEKATFPANNPYSKSKTALGERLFFDPRLSGSAQIACASCHDPDLAWADGRSVSFGHDRQPGTRNAPSVRGAAYHRTLFWDGRAASLEIQASHPIQTSNEMHADPIVVAQRLQSVPQYRQAFAEAFNGNATIDMHRVGQAIATFERSLPMGRSKFDAFLAGRSSALSDSAVRGLHLFRTTARCMNCHSGPTLSDDQFHNVGLSYYGRKNQDLGRYEITHNKEDVGAFRTPSLRDVSHTGPYMHNGMFELEGVLALYNVGMPTLRPRGEQVDDPLFPVKDALLKRLDLDEQQLADLTAFLESLAEPKLRIRPPEPWTSDASTTRP